MNSLGRILDLNLSDGTWSLSPFPEDIVYQFLGGRGFNVWYLYNQLPPGTDPLGDENLLMFSPGLLTGTAVPASSRVHINALSPQTGLIGSSNVGGDFGITLRFCGIQSFIVRGQASHPVYLVIQDGSVEIKDGQSLWGLDTWETEERIKEELDDESVKIMSIGPGGENGALFAAIVAERDHAAGRTGLGTVMGSKNLKAIVVKSRNRKPPVLSENSRESIKKFVRKIRKASDFKFVSDYGGAGYVKWCDDMNMLASQNYRSRRFESIDGIDGRNLKKHVVRLRSCRYCPIKCKADLQFNGGKQKEEINIRPEFESMVALGSKCGLRDLSTLVRLDNLCTRMGLDTISAGSAIAFAMDIYDRGILSLTDTGGIDLSWGNGQAMETLIRQMAYRQGLGAVLSQGIQRASKAFGNNTERFAPHVKGLELAGYHPSGIMGTALGYAISSRGGDFNNIYATMEYKWTAEQATREFGTPRAINLHSVQGKGLLVKRAMIVGIVLDCLGLCKVPLLSLLCRFNLETEAELSTALTGLPLKAQVLFKAGERVANLEKLFNLKHDKDNCSDYLPAMFTKTEVFAGEQERPAVQLTPMLKDFYQAMGWDEHGRPKKNTLNKLRLNPEGHVFQD
jgi:aldehyde:ferredoxin oxidoreductase